MQSPEGPRSKKVVERDSKVFSPADRIRYYSLVVSKAEGSKIWDADGREYIDFLSGAAVTNTGHRHPKVVEAIRKQLDRFIHGCSIYMYYEEVVKLAEKLTEITPGDFPKKVAFGLSGSDSNDGAIKLARTATGRTKIMSFIGSYHGTTFGALSASAISLRMRRKVGPLLPEFYHVPFPDCYRCYFGHEPPCNMQCLKYIETLFDMFIPPEEVAAILFEPIQGDAGIIVPPDSFLPRLQDICKKHGILFIDEEVQTGFARTGKMFAVEHWNLSPDVILLAKAIASGMPLSAVVAKADLMKWEAPLNFFTTQANPLSCVASLATIEVIQEERLAQRAEKLGRKVMEHFNSLKKEHKLIGDVRGKGLLIGIDLVKDRESKEPDRKAALKICWRSWENGLVLATLGRFGNVLRIAPPLTIREEELEKALEIIDNAISDVEKGKVPDNVLKQMGGW